MNEVTRGLVKKIAPKAPDLIEWDEAFLNSNIPDVYLVEQVSNEALRDCLRVHPSNFDSAFIGALGFMFVLGRLSAK